MSTAWRDSESVGNLVRLGILIFCTSFASGAEADPVLAAEGAPRLQTGAQQLEIPQAALSAIVAWRSEVKRPVNGHQLVAWQAKIVGTEKLRDGTYLLRFELRQRFKAGVSYSGGYVVEEWSLSGDAGFTFRKVIEEKSGLLFGD